MVAMYGHRWTLDVAGVPVDVEAENDRYERCVHERLGAAPSAEAGEVRLRISSTAPVPDPGAAVQPLEGLDGHELDDVIWMVDGPSAARVEGADVDVGGPLGSTAEEDVIDNLLQYGLAAAIATPGRLMLHGAAVARGDDALLLVGRSGVGKSTLAAAAFLGGWDLLGDDLTLVSVPDLRVRAVRRPPMFPAEIADGTSLVGVREHTGRRRVRLDVDVLAEGDRRLIGLVTVAHGDEGEVQLLGPGAAGVLDDAFALPPFRSVVRRQLAAGAAVLGLPAVRLGHARRPEVRIARGQELLDEAYSLCRAHGQ